MNDVATLFPTADQRPALPVPTRQRWQPLRIGLVELFHYDSEEFWFRDGHLLLRGNNGTGKSKVLSLTLPFLLDAQLKPSRIEPDGDSNKRMRWNLLMGDYDRRSGYAWIEFGRIADDGTAHYLTLGAGLAATAGRPHVESFFFVIDDGDGAPRINQGIWLTSAQRVVLTKDRLRDALAGHGQVFDAAASYRRAVDERLFRLGARRYDALMDTLIQLRQPQLSKKPDEAALSHALTEALPALAPELLSDVAEALGQLEEDRRQLEDYQALAKAVDRFEQRYRVYAGTQSRRQARALRQAQTEFDNASRARAKAQSILETALADEARALSAHEDADAALRRLRARLEILRADPTMQDANQLEAAGGEAEARRVGLQNATRGVDEAGRRAERGGEEASDADRRVAAAEGKMRDLRAECAVNADGAGIATAHAASPLAGDGAAVLEGLTQGDFERACGELRALVVGRRGQIAMLRKGHAELVRAEALSQQRRQMASERQLEAEAAAERRAEADKEVERQGAGLLDAWERHYAGLQHLRIDPADGVAVLTSLAEWVLTAHGDNPARHLLHSAQQQANLRLLERRVALEGEQKRLAIEREALHGERRRLEAGIAAMPPSPHTRAVDVREARQGAPLWQLVDFREAVAAPQRAGLEAALEAAGLLDAWIAPDGRLQAAEGGMPLHDTQLVPRPPRSQSLAAWLHATPPAEGSVPAAVVDDVLAGIGCAEDDPGDGEAWVAPDGRFRLGALVGAWTKQTAVYIGHAARSAARARRLVEIADRLVQLAEEGARVEATAEQLARDQQQIAQEFRLAPSDETLRIAHVAAAASAREAQIASQRFAEAEGRYREAEDAFAARRRRLATDAEDMRLPASLSELPDIEDALDRYHDAQVRLSQAIHELRLALPELQRRRARELELREDLRRAEEHCALARNEAVAASARFEELRQSVGARVEELQQRLTQARQALATGERALKLAGDDVRKSGEARAVARERIAAAEIALRERAEARSEVVLRLQRFAATGLLAAALPTAELPDMDSRWTVDPALTLARRIDQALLHLRDDDEAWARVQRQISEELTELQRALGALGHQAPAEQSDWGLIVLIVYQNRPERPDRLAVRLAEEIAQRSELLSARERAVLENHLEAEIACEVQRLLQAAEAQRIAVNKELHSRPTSTGVRYRLLWEPLTQEEGAPVGLDAARGRLLNTGADLWSTQDRSVVGAMLQQRIAAERERTDSGVAGDGGGGLLEQLARALDYRRWHRFRVERWQDGNWRKLSGPASSGERALGLTVPLFAAVASFYSQGSYALAPRLMLLDEAFAGIDDAARAHCMGLIRQFDLDFVITSEREWGCYAELPGVAICQLQRKEGVPAVFVSRWTWDGRARLRQADPNRRFAPA